MLKALYAIFVNEMSYETKQKIERDDKSHKRFVGISCPVQNIPIDIIGCQAGLGKIGGKKTRPRFLN